jgi:hypothetical protein
VKRGMGREWKGMRKTRKNERVGKEMGVKNRKK